MKFTILLKSPDSLHYAIENATSDEDSVVEIRKLCEKWFKYGELVTLTIDTEAKTCVVNEV